MMFKNSNVQSCGCENLPQIMSYHKNNMPKHLCRFQVHIICSLNFLKAKNLIENIPGI